MNVQTWEGKSTRVARLRLVIENSNNIRLKKSTLDTLLLRTYKQTEFLCTHINKHSSDDDDGCFHLFTASVFYPGIVVVIGDSRHQGGCVAEGSCCQRSSFQPPLARLLSLLGEHSPGVSTSSEVLSLRVQGSQEEFTQGELKSWQRSQEPRGRAGSGAGSFPRLLGRFWTLQSARCCSGLLCRKVEERERSGWAETSLARAAPLAAEQLGGLQADGHGDTGVLDPQADGQTASPGYACIQHHCASAEATIATNRCGKPRAQPEV